MNNNINKLKHLVDVLPLRDKELLEKVENFGILEHVFLTSPRPMAIMAEDWKYLLVNELFAELYGFENADDMVGKRHYELFLNIPERPIDLINNKLNDEGMWEGIIKCPHKSGQDFISKITLRRVDDKDKLLFTCEVVKDN